MAAGHRPQRAERPRLGPHPRRPRGVHRAPELLLGTLESRQILAAVARGVAEHGADVLALAVAGQDEGSSGEALFTILAGKIAVNAIRSPQGSTLVISAARVALRAGPPGAAAIGAGIVAGQTFRVLVDLQTAIASSLNAQVRQLERLNRP